MMRYMVMVGIGLFSIVTGLVVFFLLADATRKGILDAIVIDSPEHKNYARWIQDYDADDQKVYQSYYMWNLTNAAEFANGEKAIYDEVGPFVYRQYKNKTNVTFGDGGNEVTFTEHREYIFQADMSTANDETSLIVNINPFYVTAIAKSAGQESIFNLNLAAQALLTFSDSAAWGSSATQPAGTTVTGFSQAFGGQVTLTTVEAAVALTAFAGNVTNLVGYGQYILAYSTAAAAGQAEKAAGIAATINGAFPGGPDFTTPFNFAPTGKMETKASLVLFYAANVGAAVRATFVTNGGGINDGLLFRRLPVRTHIFGSDPFYAMVSGGLPIGYVKNASESKFITLKTGKDDSSLAGMDHATQLNGVSTSTAYQNAAGVGPTVVVNGRTNSMAPFQGATPDKIDVYFEENERYVSFVFNGVQEVQDIESARYLADTEAFLVKSEEWNISHTSFAPLQYWSAGAPFFASVPHQPGAEAPYADAVTGQAYNANLHSTYLDLEPITGIPLQARLALQNSLQMNFTANSYVDAPNVTQKDIMAPLYWFKRAYIMNPDTADSLRMAVVTAVVLRRAILGSLVGVGVVCVLIGAALMVQKGGSEGVSGEGKDDGANGKKADTVDKQEETELPPDDEPELQPFHPPPPVDEDGAEQEQEMDNVGPAH